MGQCYEKLGQKEARSAYERVLREFADQSAPAPGAPAARCTCACRGACHCSNPGMTVRRMLTIESGVEGTIDAKATLFSFTDWETGDLPSASSRAATRGG